MQKGRIDNVLGQILRALACNDVLEYDQECLSAESRRFDMQLPNSAVREPNYFGENGVTLGE